LVTGFLLSLLAAHITADFVLQPARWVRDKVERKWRSPFLYLHVIVHAAVMFAFLGFQGLYWSTVLLIALSHFFIDLAKLYAQHGYPRRAIAWFLADQGAHLAVIGLALYCWHPFDLCWLGTENALLLLIALLALTRVSSIAVGTLMSRWSVESLSEDASLPQAGQYIGMLERLFVFCFIALGQWQAIGFLLAAKSVFRFSDLSRAKDRQLTEYILIGTLLSFGLAIGISLLYLHVQSGLAPD
jgi:hypothetical protein